MGAQSTLPAPESWALAPVHPGAVIRDSVLPAIGKTAGEAAALMHIQPDALSAVLQGAPMTADLAVRLGKLCGNGPDLWLGMQAAYDLRQARTAIGAGLDSIPTLHEAA